MFLMGSPCGPWHRPGGLFSSKRLMPFVTKRPAAPRPGCRPRCRALGFLLSFSIAKRKKQRKMLPSERSSAFCGRRPGGAAPSAPLPPFEKGGRKLYRPSAPVGRSEPFPTSSPGGQGGTWGDWSPREAQRSLEGWAKPICPKGSPDLPQKVPAPYGTPEKEG